jgi:hypothetical protein
VRKYLGVLASVAALCLMSWAQAPAPAPTPAPTATDQTPAPADQTPAQAPTAVPATPIPTTAPKPAPVPEFPRFEFFGGGTYAETGFFNAGHWAGLPGWDASLDVNATDWIGIIVDGGQYFGNSKIPVAVPAPFPTCPPFCPASSYTFNAATREYNVLFGVQFARRKYGMWTPIGEIMYGHQGVRGQASAEGQSFTEIGTGRAIIIGGGLDRKINQRFALRIKADYFQTATDFQSVGKQKQDNFRVSVGVVIRNVHRKKRTLEDETQVGP